MPWWLEAQSSSTSYSYRQARGYTWRRPLSGNKLTIILSLDVEVDTEDPTESGPKKGGREGRMEGCPTCIAQGHDSYIIHQDTHSV